MSHENIDVVRRCWEAVSKDDALGIVEWMHPQIEMEDHDLPDAGEYRGLEGLLAWRADWESSWAEWRWEPEEFIAAGERVVVVLRLYAKGRASGVEVERLDAAICAASKEWRQWDGSRTLREHSRVYLCTPRPGVKRLSRPPVRSIGGLHASDAWTPGVGAAGFIPATSRV